MQTARSKSASVVLAVFAFAILGACSTESRQGGVDSGQSVRATQAKAPVAYLQANTGGDSMLAKRRHGYVLELHVIDGRHEIKPVAQCDRISGGSALGGGTERELDVALCEGDAKNRGEYWLISEPGRVSVRRGPIDAAQQTVQEQALRDSHARAVAKEDR